MKMFGKKSLSTYLYWVSLLCAIGFAGFILLILGSLLINGVEIDTVNNSFTLSLPFSDSIIKGIYGWTTFGAIFGFLLFYGIFFFSLNRIFKTFKAGKIFTQSAIKYLRIFAIINIVLPPLYFLIGLAISTHLDPFDLIPAGLHVLLGVFGLFIVAVFNSGYQLQEENNLTI